MPDKKPLVGALELPADGSYQSGIGIISGWVCNVQRVDIKIKTGKGGTFHWPAAYGAERPDTASVCSDLYNGFSLPVNWNLLGDGTHTLEVRADGVELGRATVTVTTLGAEFVRGVEKTFTLEGFPSPGESVEIQWSQSLQNFVIAKTIPKDE